MTDRERLIIQMAAQVADHARGEPVGARIRRLVPQMLALHDKYEAGEPTPVECPRFTRWPSAEGLDC